VEVSSNALYSYLLDDLYGDSRDYWERFLASTDISDYWPGASVRDVAKLRLARSIYKKLIDITSLDADKLCLEKFLAANSRCQNWRLNLQSSKDEELYGLFLKEIDNFLHPFGKPLVKSTMDIWSAGRLGPGASLGATGVDFYSKLFSSQLSATSSEVYQQYTEYCQWFPNWCGAELIRLSAFGFPRYTCKSSLSFVRKTRDISRSICTEPSLNMFAQLGLGEIISARLKKFFGIDLSSQPKKNVDLARCGSIDGSVVTLDLESASDSLSLGVCEAVLPSWFYNLLCDYRTPFTECDGQKVELNMVSTMGNGFTFPLQTMFFSCIVRAVSSWWGCSLPRADEPESPWGVFGDDIICPPLIAGDVVRLLNLLGFRVNSSKSYFVGPFRESCGGDFYEGVNVRGVYLKTLRTMQSRYVAINLLNEWSARTGIYLPRAVGYLVDSVRYLAVPFCENMDAGIRVPYELAIGTGPKYKYQRYYYRCYEAQVPMLGFSDDGRIHVPAAFRKRRKIIYNPDGLQIAFEGGYIRNSRVPIALKQGDRPRYRTTVKCSPFWGPLLAQLDEHRDECFWERCKSAVLRNLSVEP
jgi:hypothetical protein